MLSFLSLLGMAAAFFAGLIFPKKAGWGIVLITPLLGPASFTLVSSPLLPLTMYRIAFAVTVGVVMSNYNRNFPLKSIFRSRFVKIVLVFSLFVILISLEDRLGNIIFTYIPNLIFAFVLCFILIRNEKDLRKLVKIFVWQAAIISGFIIIEYATEFNLTYELAKTVPGYQVELLQSKQTKLNPIHTMRSGVYRPIGIDANAVQTGYRLAFLFPLTLWYMIRRKGIINKLPVSIIIVAIFLLKTKAAFVGIIISFAALLAMLLFSKSQSIIQKFRYLFKPILLLALLGIVFVLIYPSSINTGMNFYKTFMSSFDYSSEESIEGKILRIPRAIDLFLEKPFLGYLVSPIYSYSVLMRCDDLPSPFIYLLSGGIILLLIYLLMIFYMPYSVFSLSKIRGLSLPQREFLIYACSAFVGGIVVVFSNWQEAHFLIMYMLYISIYKIYRFRRYNKPAQPGGQATLQP